MLMTITAYAATHYATRQAAKNWADKGALVLVGDKVDVEASDALMKGRDLGRFRHRIHGGRRAAGVHGKIDRPAGTAAQVEADRAFAEEYPHLMRARACSPIGQAAAIERILVEFLDLGDDLLAQLDSLASNDFEIDAQAAQWHRWPSLIAADLAAELGIPAQADALEAGLRRRVIDRLERDLMVDAEIYLAPALSAYSE